MRVEKGLHVKKEPRIEKRLHVKKEPRIEKRLHAEKGPRVEKSPLVKEGLHDVGLRCSALKANGGAGGEADAAV